MKNLVFATGNEMKFRMADVVCRSYGIQLARKNADIEEVQGENAEKVAIDKADKMYAVLKEPLVITDDSWAFSGLRGFPGVYMHSVNKWLTPQDFLNLTLPLKDRRVTLTMRLVYNNNAEQKIFQTNFPGKILKEARGESKYANHTIVSLDGDEGKSIAEVYEKQNLGADHNASKVWHDFAKWYSDQE